MIHLRRSCARLLSSLPSPSMLALLLPSLLVAACAATPPGDGGSGSGMVSINEQPVSTQKAGDDERESAMAHTALGKEYAFAGALQVALEEGQIALEADSSYAPAYSLLGKTYFLLDQNERARSNYIQALRLAPRDPEIQAEYAWFLCHDGDMSGATSYFDKALNNPLMQNQAEVLSDRGICAIMQGDDVAAATYLQRSLLLRANNPRALYMLTDIDFRAGRYSSAIVKLNKLHEQRSPTAETSWLGLRLERKLGNKQGVERYTSLLLDRFRASPEYEKLVRGEFE